MKYQSTRNNSVCVESAYAIGNGISPEGGLYVPESLPTLTLDDICALCSLTDKERA